MEDDLRNVKNVELLMQDLLRLRYKGAVSKMQELKQRYGDDKEAIDMNFHPQAGNALALAFGNFSPT